MWFLHKVERGLSTQPSPGNKKTLVLTTIVCVSGVFKLSSWNFMSWVDWSAHTMIRFKEVPWSFQTHWLSLDRQYHTFTQSLSSVWSSASHVSLCWCIIWCISVASYQTTVSSLGRHVVSPASVCPRSDVSSCERGGLITASNDHRQKRRHLIIDHSQPCHTRGQPSPF